MEAGGTPVNEEKLCLSIDPPPDIKSEYRIRCSSVGNHYPFRHLTIEKRTQANAAVDACGLNLLTWNFPSSGHLVYGIRCILQESAMYLAGDGIIV